MSSSVGPDCTELKSSMIPALINGDTTPECEDLFKDYRACVMVTLKEKGIDKLLSESVKNHPSQHMTENQKIVLKNKQIA
ncbi:unnamed protein product [Cunninghamella echinulata]